MLPKKLKATPEARALLIRQAATLTLIDLVSKGGNGSKIRDTVFENH